MPRTAHIQCRLLHYSSDISNGTTLTTSTFYYERWRWHQMPCSSHLTKTKNVCLRCFRVLTLGMRPLALGGGIISLRHRVVLAPLTRLRASHDEMVPQAMCVRVARWFHVTNGRVSLGYSRSTLCVEPMSLMSNKYWAPIKLALFTHSFPRCFVL